ncbi:MAG: hypothetical protein NVS2B17_01280 [Candidatus Velthaea sp.]
MRIGELPEQLGNERSRSWFERHIVAGKGDAAYFVHDNEIRRFPPDDRITRCNSRLKSFQEAPPPYA